MKIHLVSLFAVAVICGCTTTSAPVNLADEIEKIDREDGVDVVSTETLEDTNFSYTMGDEHTRSFKMINPNATLNDLNDFAYAVCWNGYLRPKLQNEQKLSREDAVLLDFCINVQLNMVDTLAVASFGDMTDVGYLHDFIVKEADRSYAREKDLEGIYREQNNVFVDLKVNFLKSNEGIRVPMSLWGNEFRAVPPEVMKRIFIDVENATGTIDTSERPWLWSDTLRTVVGGAMGAALGGAAVGTVAGPISAAVGAVAGGVGGATWRMTAPGMPNELEQGAMALKTPVVDMKNKWRSARDVMSVYLTEMRNMRRELMSVRTGGYLQDSQTRKYIQRVLAESENDNIAVSQYLDYAMYDVPFCVMTYKVNGQLAECKGRFNDNEESMMKVMSEYCQAVSGTEMLKHIRTRYAANGYIEAITFLKKELSSKEFETFVNESKLYKVEQKVDNVGRQQNDLSPISGK